MSKRKIDTASLSFIFLFSLHSSRREEADLMPQGLRCFADEGRLKLEKGFVLLSLSLLLFFVR